jgi:Phospholipase C
VLFPGYVRHAEQLVAGPDSYDTYGFRVPAVILSPYARPDCVLSDVFDHTSVLKLIEEKWNLPALTRRDAAATAPLGALDLTAPPAFLSAAAAARTGAGVGHLVSRRIERGRMRR